MSMEYEQDTYGGGNQGDNDAFDNDDFVDGGNREDVRV